MKMRLQKFLSQAGVSSRREGEKLILAGKVQVNGVRVTELGTQVDDDRDRISLEGKEIGKRERLVYYLFHKPKNVMVTRKDPEGRPTIYDYLKGIPERVNPVGRLDFDSEGLILLTNDGGLQNRLTHPSKEVPKVYRVKVGPVGADLRVGPGEHVGSPLHSMIQQLSSGVDIGGYVTAPCRVKEIGDDWLEITITEGKNRQVRRMCEAVGLTVLRLIRTAIGTLELGSLPAGRYCPLTRLELEQLKK